MPAPNKIAAAERLHPRTRSLMLDLPRLDLRSYAPGATTFPYTWLGGTDRAI
jgi:hypothetical protein